MKKLLYSIVFLILLPFYKLPAIPLFEANTLRQLDTWLENNQKGVTSTSTFLTFEQQLELISIDFKSVAKLIPILHAHKKIHPNNTSNLTIYEIASLYTKLVGLIFGKQYETYLQIYQQNKDRILNEGNFPQDYIGLKFIEKYFNFSCNNQTGKTILHEAVINEGPCLPILLESEYLDVNAQDCSGFTALHHAIFNIENNVYEQEDNEESIEENTAVLSLLLQAGCNPNIQDFYGSTPLHYAAIAGLPNTTQLLLNYEANPLIKNFKNKSATDCAEEEWKNVEEEDPAQERIFQVYSILFT